MNKPILKITTHPTSKHKYLSVITKPPYRTLGSFGNAQDPENWDRCITFLLERLREYYKDKAKSYIESST